MNPKQALHELGVKSNAISASQKQQLDEQGYFIVENAFSKSNVQKIRDEFERIHALEADQSRVCHHLQFIDVAQRHFEKGWCAPSHVTPHRYAPRLTAAACSNCPHHQRPL